MPEMVYLSKFQVSMIPCRVEGVDDTSYTRTDLADKLRQECDNALKREKVLRDALEQKILEKTLRQYMFEQFPATDGHIPFMQFCGRQEQALYTPATSNLVVLSLDELKKCPCGCYTNTQTDVTTRGQRIKCPHCQLIEKMEGVK